MIVFATYFRHRPPHLFIKGNTPLGPMVEILEKVVSNLGYKLIWQFRPFETSFNDLKSGDTDIVPRFLVNEERKKFAHFLRACCI